VNRLDPSLAGLLDALASELQTQLSERHAENIDASWTDDAEGPSADLICWSWILSIDSASRILVGAPAGTWTEICGLSEEVPPEDLRDGCLAWLTPAVEQAAKSRFGSQVTCSEAEDSEAPTAQWTSVQFTITRASGIEVSVQVSVNPDLRTALGVPEDSVAAEETHSASPSGGPNSVEILMDVELPVSVSLGRTKMRLKELLHLTNGSVVELDQELSDEVEIRVNNCVIAYGEVVAVDGNYAVRILRMAPARTTAGLRGMLPERAA
jgi:flagellar motor switch protein FliN/FliY